MVLLAELSGTLRRVVRIRSLGAAAQPAFLGRCFLCRVLLWLLFLCVALLSVSPSLGRCLLSRVLLWLLFLCVALLSLLPRDDATFAVSCYDCCSFVFLSLSLPLLLFRSVVSLRYSLSLWWEPASVPLIYMLSSPTQRHPAPLRTNSIIAIAAKAPHSFWRVFWSVTVQFCILK